MEMVRARVIAHPQVGSRGIDPLSEALARLVDLDQVLKWAAEKADKNGQTELYNMTSGCRVLCREAAQAIGRVQS